MLLQDLNKFTRLTFEKYIFDDTLYTLINLDRVRKLGDSLFESVFLCIPG